MEYTIYKTYLSNPEAELILKVRESSEYTNGFITLLGSDEVLKDKFYQKIFETAQKSKALKSHEVNEDKSRVNETNLPNFKGAKILFDYTTEEKTIWCNTEDLTTNKLKESCVALRNLIKYSSKIILFIEFSDYAKLKSCEAIFSEILNHKDLIEDLEILVCIKIISARWKLEKIRQDINQNYFKDLRMAPNNLKFEFIKYSYDDDADDFEFFNESWISGVKRCSKKLDFSKFFEEINYPEINDKLRGKVLAMDTSSDINEILGLSANRDITENNPDIQKLEKGKHKSQKQEANLSYHQVMETNFENYVNDNCLTKNDLESWKASKEEEINKELEIIKRIYQKRLSFFETEERFKKFLNKNKIEICNHIPASGNDYESKIEYWVNSFIEIESNNHSLQRQINHTLCKIAKEFLYTVVEKLINESNAYLEKYLSKINDECIQLIKEFKSAPYKVEVEYEFTKLKRKWQDNLMMKSYARENESRGTLNKRIEEHRTLINSIKSQIPALDFKVMNCIKCAKLGTMRSEDHIDFITLDELNTDAKSRKINCVSCKVKFRAIDFKGKIYHFDIDENNHVNLIKMALY